MNALENEIDCATVFKAVGLSAGFSGQEGFLTDIDLEIRSGERVAILGDHMARAQLLRVLAGLRPARGGTLEVLEHAAQKLPFYADWDGILPQSVRRRLGICLEVEGLLNNVSVREGLELLFRFKYGDHNEKLRQGAARVVTLTCEIFGLGTAVEKRPYLLSSAERRLAGLARAFLTKPRVLVLENPSLSIGDSSRDKLYSALEQMTSQEERTMLVSTEDWALAHRFCPRWVVLDQARIVFDGSAGEFLRSKHPLLEQLHALERMQTAFASLLSESAKESAA